MKILAINDLAGYGRISLTTSISVISASGNQCVPVPTSIYSTHTAYKNFKTQDLTTLLMQTLEQYNELNLEFDYIYSGFLNSLEQIEMVKFASKSYSKAKLLVDPVMGDNDKKYQTLTSEICCKMIELAKVCDILTPNITELKILLGIDPSLKITSLNEVTELVKSLKILCKGIIIVTGIEVELGFIHTILYENEDIILFKTEKIDGYYPGTGDLFASVLVSQLCNGKTMSESVNLSCNFVYEAIKSTQKISKNNLEGVIYEPFLYKLAKKD